MPSPEKHNFPTLIVTIISATIVALHCFAAAYPSATNWGTHHLAFLPLSLTIAVILMMVVMLLRVSQDTLLLWIGKLVRTILGFHPLLKLATVVVSVAVMVVLFLVGRERLMFLGDGYLVMRSVEALQNVELIPTLSFYDAPVSTLLIYKASKFFMILNQTSAEEFAFRSVSIAFGVGWIFLTYWLSRLLTNDILERVLVILFLLGSAGTQLYFGYVEVYTPAAFTVALFITSSMAHFRKHVPLLFPAIVFGCLLATHFTTAILFPAFCWLCYTELRAGKIRSVIISLFGAITVFALLMVSSGYSFETFLAILGRSGSHRVPLFSADGGVYAYTLFSLSHFSEIINLFLLVSPFALPVLVLVLVVKFKSIRWSDPEWVFVMLTVFSGLGFLFIMNADLGMSRDWDVFSLSMAGILVAFLIACLKHISPEIDRRRVLIMVAVLTLLHTIPWIALNATEEPALERFGKLQDSRYWGRVAITDSYEALAVYYRTKGDLLNARAYYEKYIAVDSTNGRIFTNCAVVCQNMHDDSSAIQYFEQAIQHNTVVKSSYIDLGVLYATQGRLQDAVDITLRGLEINPRSTIALNNVGVYLIQMKQDYMEALGYFLQSLEIDSTNSESYLNAGKCYYFLNKRDEMKAFFSRFLELRPDYPDSDELRRLMRNNN